MIRRSAMRIVEEEKLRDLIKEPEALESAERAFRALAEGSVEQPPPMALDVAPVRGEVHVKGAYLKGSKIFAIKVASGFYGNSDKNLPTGSGLVLVFDAETGFPLALLRDNAYLTDLRTAAAGALAARLLAPKSVGRVAMLGSGVQARYQLRAIARVCEFERVDVWSPHRDRVEAYCQEMQGELGKSVSSADTPEQALQGAQLVVTCTPSREPLVETSWLEPDATVIAVGSDGPDKQELAAEAVAKADKVVADRFSQCVRLGEIHHAVEAGLFKEEALHAELGEVLIGRKAGREGKELIVCDLTGVGAQDAAIAEVAWERC